mmetsp:Transcript_30626/g.78178  ORF Transcript_30626/g.78178 Transcript_30626/m.78178 type:complete len:229 (-) Transcript_30626:129-815(-)
MQTPHVPSSLDYPGLGGTTRTKQPLFLLHPSSARCSGVQPSNEPCAEPWHQNSTSKLNMSGSLPCCSQPSRWPGWLISSAQLPRPLSAEPPPPCACCRPGCAPAPPAACAPRPARAASSPAARRAPRPAAQPRRPPAWRAPRAAAPRCVGPPRARPWLPPPWPPPLPPLSSAPPPPKQPAAARAQTAQRAARWWWLPPPPPQPCLYAGTGACSSDPRLWEMLAGHPCL